MKLRILTAFVIMSFLGVAVGKTEKNSSAPSSVKRKVASDIKVCGFETVTLTENTFVVVNILSADFSKTHECVKQTKPFSMSNLDETRCLEKYGYPTMCIYIEKE